MAWCVILEQSGMVILLFELKASLDIGQVVTKIIKHAREAAGNASGLLLGIDLNGTLEVSNSFALPTSSDSDEGSQKG
jgi:hypothetical protein